MPLRGCKMCGKVFNSETRRICPNCINRLRELYGRIHEYMRDHEDEEFDIDTLSEAMDINPADIQALVDLGYIERDLQTYLKEKQRREKLARAFKDELEKIKDKGIMTYGGIVYSREPEDELHYAYDRQHTDNMKIMRRTSND